MTARSYFTLLRPVRTLLLWVCYTLVSWSWAASFFRLPGPLARFVALALVCPVLLGTFLLGPLHEAMHRSFSVTLPGMLPTFRRFHLRTVAATAVLLAILLHFTVGDLGPAADLGWALIGLSLPLFNRRRRSWRRLRIWYLVLLVGGAALVYLGAGSLHRLGLEFPWLVLAAGASMLVVGLRVAFSFEGLRERSRDPLFCVQSTILMNRDILALQRAQVLQRSASPERGREIDLSGLVVDGRTWSWLRALHLARSGGRSSYLRTMIVVCLVVPFWVFVAALIMSRAMPNPAGFHRTCELLLSPEASGGLMAKGDPVSGILLLTSPIVSFVLALAASQMSVWRQYPASRDRLAWYNFVLSLGLALLVGALTLVGMLALLVVLGLVSGVPLTPEPFVRLSSEYLVFVPGLPLALGAIVGRRMWTRIVGLVCALIPVLAGAVGAYFYSGGWLMSLAGLGIAGTLTVGTGWFYWRRLRKQFRTRDFIADNSFARLFGA